MRIILTFKIGYVMIITVRLVMNPATEDMFNIRPSVYLKKIDAQIFGSSFSDVSVNQFAFRSLSALPADLGGFKSFQSLLKELRVTNEVHQVQDATLEELAQRELLPWEGSSSGAVLQTSLDLKEFLLEPRSTNIEDVAASQGTEVFILY